MRAVASDRQLVVLWVLALAALISTPIGGAARAADIYLSAELRASLASVDFGGFEDPPAALPVSVSGEPNDWGLLFAGSLGIAQPLEAWELRGRSLAGWALRGEIELDSRRKYKLSSSGPLGPGSRVAAHIEARAILTNFWLDFPIRKRLSGYAGFGLGMAGANISAGDRIDWSFYSGRRKQRNFAFQIGAGVEYPLLGPLRISAGYRYLNLGDYKVPLTTSAGARTGRITVDLSSHELILGLRLSFDFLSSPLD